MLSRFQDRTWTKDIAGLRNNDIGSGINLCRSLEPGTNAHWRDQAVDHAIAHFGKRLINALDQVLKKQDISNAKTIGALRLAGHIADPL